MKAKAKADAEAEAEALLLSPTDHNFSRMLVLRIFK